jgi:hypothetical protein
MAGITRREDDKKLNASKTDEENGRLKWDTSIMKK